MALIPPAFLNTVVALGSPSHDGKVQYTATGFLYGFPSGEIDEKGRARYFVFLVTNRHVFQRGFERNDTLFARFNKLMESGANVYPIKQNDAAWTVHPDSDADVAVLSVNPNQLESDRIEYVWFNPDTHALTFEQANSQGVSEGDGIFVLGFPLGEVGDERNYVIVRQGIIARIQHWLMGNASTFLIDASIFPGNSGGPVLLKPEIASIQGTRANNSCSLIGMVSSYLPYREVAISEQTGRRRMVFEENSGLAKVVPHNVIQEVIKVAVDRLTLGETMTLERDE